MNYSHEVENMCTVKKGPHHGPAPIPEEGKWVKSYQISDISGLSHGVGSVSYTHLHDPKDRLLCGRCPPGRGQGPYHRRPDTPLNPGGAVHRRRHRHHVLLIKAPLGRYLARSDFP